MAAQLISLVLGWLILALGIAAAGWLIPGIRLGGWESTLGVAAVLGVFNLFFRPLLVFFTLPLVLLSLLGCSSSSSTRSFCLRRSG